MEYNKLVQLKNLLDEAKEDESLLIIMPQDGEYAEQDYEILGILWHGDNALKVLID